MPQSTSNNNVGQHLVVQKRGKTGTNDKRLVVFLTGMEKPPTFCHLLSGSHKIALGLQQEQQLYTGEHILTSVP